EGPPGPRDPDREVAQFAVAPAEGPCLRRALLRPRPREHAADLADGPIRPQQRPQARVMDREGPTRPVLVRSLGPGLEASLYLPAAAEGSGRRFEHDRFPPNDRHRPRPRPALAGVADLHSLIRSRSSPGTPGLQPGYSIPVLAEKKKEN